MSVQTKKQSKKFSKLGLLLLENLSEFGYQTPLVYTFNHLMTTVPTAQFSQLLQANAIHVEDTIKQCIKDLEISGFEIENQPRNIEQLVLVLKELIDSALSRNDDRIRRFLYQVDVGEELVQKALFSGSSEHEKDPFERLAISIVMREYQKTKFRKQYSNE